MRNLRLPLFLFPLKSLSAIPADYIDLPRCPDDGAAAGADIFNTAVNGFLTSALGGAFHRQATGANFILTRGFSDPCLRLRGQRCYRPAILGVLLDMQAVGLSGGLKFLVVVIAVVAYGLDAMHQIVEMRHLMQERGCQLDVLVPLDFLAVYHKANRNRIPQFRCDFSCFHCIFHLSFFLGLVPVENQAVKEKVAIFFALPLKV